MKDFSVKIDNLILDRYTQDSRVLKIKLWIHFTDNMLKDEVTLDNPQEILDMNLSLYTSANYQCLFEMQEH